MRALVFVWENFGPIHADRVESATRLLAGTRDVVAIELAGRSDTYGWKSEDRQTFQKLTLFQNASLAAVPFWRQLRRVLTVCLRYRGEFFLCHYERPLTFLLAIILRALGNKVFVMNDSKFDDYKRYLFREFGKAILYSPYSGALASGDRSCDYLRYLGVSSSKIHVNYNTLSTSRIRTLSGTVPAPGGAPFADRHFSIVARFVPKKNLLIAIEAYALYLQSAVSPRPLHLYGGGPLEGALRARAHELGLDGRAIFHGFVQSDEIAKALGATLALLLPSTEEQFGNVVIEAQAMGLPVILSENCGARDLLVRSGVNGFVVEPDNVRGLAYFMSLVSDDEALWRRLSLASAEFGELGDSRGFASAVERLIQPSPTRRLGEPLPF